MRSESTVRKTFFLVQNVRQNKTFFSHTTENILVEKSDEQVVEVMNGCICCTVRGDLSKVLLRLYPKIKDFDGVLIETTGLADPAPCGSDLFR